MLKPIETQFVTKNIDNPSKPIDSSSSFQTLFFWYDVSISRKICAIEPKDAIQNVDPHAKNEYQQYFLPSVTRKNTLRERNVFQMKYPNELNQKNVAITLTWAIMSKREVRKKQSFLSLRFSSNFYHWYLCSSSPLYILT